MTGAIPMTDEILAHIAAPATRQTDHLYHTLADAYREFAPCTSLRDHHGTAAPCDGAMASIAHTSMISISRESYGSFPSHLSSEDQGPDATEHGALSAPSRLGRLERIHQNWKQRTTPATSFAHRPVLAQDRPQDPANYVNTSFIEDTQEAILALQSQLQVTASMTSGHTEETEDSHLEPDDIVPVLQVSDVVQGVVEENVEILSSALGLANTDTNVLTPAHRAVPTKTAASPKPSSPIVQEQEQAAADEISAVNLLDVRKLPLHVFPPPPTISTAQYCKLPSQVTAYLAAVKARHPKRFKLLTKKYTPKTYDRGYWVVDCVQWPSKVQIEFWQEMQGLVQGGELGWGTTLHRVEEGSPAIGQVRLYCWAEVAEHMWLQLWLSSGGQVGRTSAKWHDADGIAILEAVLESKGQERYK